MLNEMLKRLFTIVCCVLMSAAVSLSAWGAPSGLNVIPTADVLDRGTVSLEFETAGPGLPWDSGCDDFLLFQIGAGNGVELGVDRCLNDPESWINVKWRVLDESDGRPALALGVQGIGYDDVAQPYVVALKTFGDTRLHTGLLAIDGKTRWMLGADHPLSRQVVLQADYTSGDENSTTFGIAFAVSDSLSLTVARSVGNSAETGNGYIVNLAWSRVL